MSVHENDTIYLKEVKYECVYSAMYTKKVMYEKFGMWNKAIFTQNQSHPILLWENVELFKNDTLKYNIATTGDENMQTIYASIIITDKFGNDMLSDSSPVNQKLIDLFGNFIRMYASKESDFYYRYWSMVDPKVANKIKKQAFAISGTTYYGRIISYKVFPTFKLT